jgi:hypothetical protein
MGGAMQPATGTLRPQTLNLPVFNETTSALVSNQISHRTSVGASVSYTIAGGNGAEAELYMPQQRTESLQGSLTYALSNRTAVGTTLQVSHILIDSRGFEYWIAIEGVFYRRLLTRSLTLIAGAGIAEVWSRETGWRFTLGPAGSLSLAGSLYSYHQGVFFFDLSYGSALSPIVNQLDGRLQTSLTGSLSAVARRNRTTLAARMGAGQTFPIDSDEVHYVGLGVVASQNLGEGADVFAGYATSIQVSPSAGLSASRQWNAFIGISLRAPAIRF